jgi:hypothetical protein
MNTEKEVIEKIKVLKQIKPEKNWVFLTKEKILGKELTFFPFLKPVFAGSLFILILFAISFTFLSESRFYLINKLIKGEKAVFISEEKESKLELELANKKLEELSKIAKTQSVEKLAPAINQTKESVAKATQNLVKSKKVNKEIAKKALELENKKKEVEKILGTKITNGEVESPIKFVAQYLIEDLENRSLGEEQRKTFEKAKEYFENGDFTKVIELLLLINNN